MIGMPREPYKLPSGSQSQWISVTAPAPHKGNNSIEVGEERYVTFISFIPTTTIIYTTELLNVVEL